MLLLLPLSFLTTSILIAARLFPEAGWRLAILRGSVTSGVVAVAGLEVLSLFELIDQSGLAILWSLLEIVALIGLYLVGRRAPSHPGGSRKLPFGWMEATVIAGMVGLAVITMLVATPVMAIAQEILQISMLSVRMAP